MVDTTQKQEALQAVRLLYKLAMRQVVFDTDKEAEVPYQARRVIEQFIESAGVLDNTQPQKTGLVLSAFINGTRWHFGDTVKIGNGSPGVITGIDGRNDCLKVLLTDGTGEVWCLVSDAEKVETK